MIEVMAGFLGKHIPISLYPFLSVAPLLHQAKDILMKRHKVFLNSCRNSV